MEHTLQGQNKASNPDVGPSRVKERRAVVLAATVAGAALLLLAGVADQLGLSTRPGWGPGQWLLASTACVVALSAMGAAAMHGRWGDVARRVWLAVMGTLVILVALECGWRIAEKSRAAEEHSLNTPIPDARLGLRLRPSAGGHDEWGFRNTSVPHRADIVAIGDSQTYGINVSQFSAWPQVLGRLTDKRVYNMALGYYGTVQYWALVEDALRLAPKDIVIGFYAGNDLYGAYQTAYTNTVYASLRDPKLEPKIREDTVGSAAEGLRSEECGFQTRYSMRTMTGLARANCALVRLLYNTGLWPDCRFEAAQAWAASYPEHGAVYAEAGVSTVMTPPVPSDGHGSG